MITHQVTMSLAPWTALTTPSRDTQLAHTAFPDRAPHTAWYFDESRQESEGTIIPLIKSPR